MNKIFILALFAGAMAIQTTQASFILYTNQTQFINQLSPYYLDTYSDLADGTTASPTNRTDGSFSYQITGGDYVVTSAIGYSDSAISTGNPDTDIDFDTFVGGVDAVGGYFFLTEQLEDKTNGTLTVSLNGGAFSTNIVSTIGQLNQFLGWIATGGDVISSVNVNTTSGQYNSVDDFTIGQAIPEPAVLSFIGLFGGGMLVVRRIFFS